MSGVGRSLVDGEYKTTLIGYNPVANCYSGAWSVIFSNFFAENILFLFIFIYKITNFVNFAFFPFSSFILFH